MEKTEQEPAEFSAGQALGPADAWLDWLLHFMAVRRLSPWHREEIQPRLQKLPLQAVLIALERGGAKPDGVQSEFYRLWIAANPKSDLLWAAWFNLGVVLARCGQREDAAGAYGQAYLLRPDQSCIAINLGLLREASGQPELALTIWEQALQQDAARIALLTQQGRLLENLGRFEAAERTLQNVLRIDPAQPDVLHHWVHLRQKICEWPVTLENIPGLPPAAQLNNAGPLGILALTDDIGQQILAAANWVHRKTAPAPRLAPVTPYRHERIRIGYLSSDFCSHAMSYLITELFERHDRARFEVYGYCSSLEDGSALRQRVLAAFDHRRMVREVPDEMVARLIRQDEIDILVELNGITDGSRLPVLRWKPAPVQATYLGYIGPLPLPELDYLLCDDTVIPPELAAKYQPAPLAIGPVYQANDSRRGIGRKLTRAELGLPADRFIFCCFTKHFKITEPLFAAWMEILRLAPNAILWLAADNIASQTRLLARAAQAGIGADRLVFSPRADPESYMQRLALADLFLDSFPYNAGTVASDALRMGLPLLTLRGEAFAARMAASLLTAIGARRGITERMQDYVALAVRLANDPAAYADFKSLFSPQAWAETLGDTARFTASYEAAWLQVMAQRQQSVHAAPEMPPEPAPAEAAYRRGVLCQAQNLNAEAGQAYALALALDPDHADALVNLGTLELGQGRPEAAAQAYRRALGLNPRHALARGNLGKALHDLGDFEAAILAYREAISLRPDSAINYLNLGAALLELKQWEASLDATRIALAMQPENAIGWSNLGTALLQAGRYEEALAACREALALAPREARILGCLGGMMQELGEAAEAITLCEAAIALDPVRPESYFNLSHAHKALNQLDAAQEAVRAAIARAPEEAQYHFHLAHVLLLQGALAEGWLEYEWRWRLPNFARVNALRTGFKQPQWRGEAISGKTMLVYTEQGIGDIIQFARFLPLLHRQGAKVILAAQPHMLGLLRTLEGVALVSITEPLPPCDAHCPLLSLPLGFATQLETIPAQIPYLYPEPAAAARWRARIEGGGIRVGIVWAGNPEVMRDRFRSPGLAAMLALFNVPDVAFVALQMGAGRGDLARHALPPNVLDLGGEIGDLADTAAIMAGLDLVISSCTGPLHLAGALGVPCWAILPFAPHFPWLLEREDTLWYPTMRLYRQHAPGRDWSGIITRIAADLAVLAQAGAAPAPARQAAE